MTAEKISKLENARTFLLNLSRGHVPERPASPYGGLVDWDSIRQDARAAYEILMKVKPREVP